MARRQGTSPWMSHSLLRGPATRAARPVRRRSPRRQRWRGGGRPSARVPPPGPRSRPDRTVFLAGEDANRFENLVPAACHLDPSYGAIGKVAAGEGARQVRPRAGRIGADGQRPRGGRRALHARVPRDLSAARRAPGQRGRVGRALDWLMEHPVDVVVTDLKMPGSLDGIELLQNIRQCGLDTEVRPRRRSRP